MQEPIEMSVVQLIIEELLSDPKFLRDEAAMERFQAVHSKMEDLLRRYGDVNDQHFQGTLNEKVYSFLISHALKHISSKDNSPLGVVRYEGRQYEILPTTEIMKLINEKIAADSTGGMNQIYVKTGNLDVPSFCVQNQNQKAQKLQRRKTRLIEFTKICNEMLLPPSNADIPYPSFDSPLFRWEGNLIHNIKFLETVKRVTKPKEPDEISKNTEISSTLKHVKPPTVGVNEDNNTINIDKISEDNKILRRMLKNKVRNHRKSIKRKEARLKNIVEKPDHETTPSTPTSTALITAAKPAMPSYIISEGVESESHTNPKFATTKLFLNTNPNPARLEKDAHYICWFDTSGGQFCYRKLLRTCKTKKTLRHVPYQRFKNKPHDTESSPVIKIDFELLQTNSIIEQCLAEMKETCVANTLPPSTNERPPWNPVYENLYIMEVQSNQQHEKHWSSKVAIWKYPMYFNAIPIEIRSG